MMDLKTNSFYKTALAVAVLINIVAAIFSIGYYYADEHYQLIEFAGYKLGTHTAKELAWEFTYQLRPALQPAICFVFIRFAELLTIHDPYDQALFLRLFSVILSLATSTLLIRTFVNEFKTELTQKIFITLSFFLWFIPFMNARFSSETWAGAFFIISICLLKKTQLHNTTMQKAIAVVIIALTVLLRYQMLMPLFFAAIWFTVLGKNRIASLMITGGVILSFISGAIVDHWFYGEWTLPLYNYAHMVITGSGPDFGSQPWYYYFTAISSKSFLPIGILLLFSFLLFWIKSPKHLISFITLPFLIIHALLPHKELRFLFPLIMFCPYVIAWLIEKINLQIGKTNPLFQKGFNSILMILFVCNGALMIACITLPASPGIAIAETIHKKYPQQEIVLLHTPYSNPYSPFESVPLKFYSEKNIAQLKVNNAVALPDSVLNLKPITLFSLRADDYLLNKDYLRSKKFEVVKYALPEILIKLNADIWYHANDNFVLLEKK